MDANLRSLAEQSKAWPFQQAKEILKKINYKTPEKGYVLFETGYGPSGLPHIGTFGEVVRTTMVMHAFKILSDIPTRLFCISDDMDAMRKIPDTIPNPEEYKKYLDLPLTTIPDPFGTHESFGAHMNARMQSFLDKYNFEYEFFSATELYKSGKYNAALIKVLDNYEKIMDIMLPTLGEERRKTYSPFLPIDPETGKVLQVPMKSIDKKNHTITFDTPSGKEVTTKVTDGTCKLQWKPDFGMRWAALDVDFEMYGKDHLVNGPLYSKICAIIGGKVPHQMNYELFLDENGQKISKSKGNGITIEEWLKYGTEESLMYYMFMAPQRAKKLYFDVIPKSVDEHIAHWKNFATQEPAKQLDNPAYHVACGDPGSSENLISFALLINLVSACNADDPKILWGYIQRMLPNVNPENSGYLGTMVGRAVNFYNDFIKPNKKYRSPSDLEKEFMLKLASELDSMAESLTAEEIQSKVYAIGMESGLELKDWFAALYQVLLGAERGPRFGSFVALYGIKETADLIRKKCSM